MNERLKKVREILGLSRAEFGQKLGIKERAYGLIESGNRPISEKRILSVCAIFGINEDWLRTGNGEMFNKSIDNLLDELSMKLHMSAIEKEIVELYFKLPESDRETISNLIKKLAAGDTTMNTPFAQWHMALKDSKDEDS